MCLSGILCECHVNALVLSTYLGYAKKKNARAAQMLVSTKHGFRLTLAWLEM